MKHLPEKLGGYEIVRPIGRGGMAEVLLARLSGADGFRREVVIKRILSDFSTDEGFVNMFRDEAHITAQLRHGNIVQVLEFLEDAGQYWLVLEYVEGPALSDLIRPLHETGKKLPVVVAMHILVEIARALDYAHRKKGPDGQPLGIIHRDVSTSNVLVSRDGEVKLTDFGIARAESRISTTKSGNIKGKLRYMAPEMLLGVPDQRSDLFALGAMAYELFVGQGPFEAESIPARMMRIMSTPSQTVASLVPGFPPVASDIVARLLEKKVEARPARAGEVADALAPLVAASGENPVDLLADLVAQHSPRGAQGERTVVGTAQRVLVLVVERSATARALVRATLGQVVDVMDVPDASSAVDAMRDTPVALVLSQQLPSGAASGIDLCAQLRASSGKPDLPFLLIASDPTPELEREALDAGITAVIAKTDRDALLKAVKRAIGG